MLNSSATINPRTVLFLRIKRFLFKIRIYIFAVLLILLLVFLNNYGVFNISKVHVKGIRSDNLTYISNDEISGIKKNILGKSYFDITYESISKQMSKIPYVQSFAIDKKFPYTVIIEIVERKPAYYITSGNNECALLDSSAYTLNAGSNKEECETLYKSSKVDALTVTSTQYQTFNAGEQSSYLFVLNFNDIRKVFDEYSYGIEKIKVKDGVCEVFVNENQSFVFSFNQELKTQLARFVVVSDQIKSKNIEYSLVDLRYERPVIRGKE
ncbi:MAG TPA: FtsQ-type POTRA domain-containing protein [Candidatus Dojkabacteria bacterium]|nr:FtsQ-type POTRA domain-containing protein [Candidatus Dojkabacteria bacterium]